MDPTLTTILLLLLFGTVIALMQARKRDKCLKDFDSFHVTMAEKGGDLSWGRSTVYPTGIEIDYIEPVTAREGHLEHSFIFYREQYEAMEALYRYTASLTDAEKQRRRAVIKQTADPSLLRRLSRQMRNWISMVRDALLQAVTLIIGTAKTRAPGSAVLSTQEPQLKSLSNEIIGHAGNAFDPLLEAHLFQEVVLEVTRGGQKHSYCGWLKDYTTQFIEVVDAVANARHEQHPVEAYAVGDARLDGLTLAVEAGRLHIRNDTEQMLYVERVSAGAWMRPMGTVLPSGYAANLTLPSSTDAEQLRARIGTVGRVDMVVPRTHAIVRHAGRRPAGKPTARSRPQAEDGPARVAAADIYARE